jgi:hypothetical protein
MQVHTIVARTVGRWLPLMAGGMAAACVSVTGHATDDSGAPEGDTAPPMMDCPQYSGLTQGRVADYQYNAEQEALMGAYHWTETSTPRTPTETEVGVLIVTEGELELVDFDSYHISTLTEGYCDIDGYWITRTDSVNDFVLQGEETIQGTSIVYSPPVFTLPRELAEGDTWTSELSGHVVYSDGVEADYADTLEYTVLGFESVRVPAGRFQTMLVERAHPVHPLEMWLDPTVGLVASSTTELLSHVEYPP